MHPFSDPIATTSPTAKQNIVKRLFQYQIPFIKVVKNVP